jgi:hypothetical protein
MFPDTNVWSDIFHSRGDGNGAGTKLKTFERMCCGLPAGHREINTVWFKIPTSFALSIQISTLDASSTGVDTKSDITIPTSLVPVGWAGSSEARIPTTSNTIVSLFSWLQTRFIVGQ